MFSFQSIFCKEDWYEELNLNILLILQDYGITPVAKTCFTMALPQIVDVLKNRHSKVNNIILCGVESHVCVLATCQVNLGDNFIISRPVIGQLSSILSSHWSNFVFDHTWFQDYLELGYNMHVVADCSSSRNNVDRMFAFQRMKVGKILSQFFLD